MSDDDVVQVTVSDPPEDPVDVLIGDTNLVVTQALLQEHREEGTPHAAYDDMDSLTLLFENGLF